MIRLFAAAIAAALVAACSGGGTADTAAPPSPAIYRISNPSGEVEGWLFGTIHALPDGAEWRTERLDNIVGKASVLVVEVAALGDGETVTRAFNRLAVGSQSSFLRDRVNPTDRAALAAIVEQSGVSEREFYHMDSWAAALVLARTLGTGEPENGADRALLADFAGREVIELEGAANQLALFDALPEADQRDLLQSVIEESRIGPAASRARAEAWRTGDAAALEAETRKGLLADPELREVLLVERNAAWAKRLETIIAAEPVLLIAVGAAHLPGEDGLVALLERRGYTVTRIQ